MHFIVQQARAVAQGGLTLLPACVSGPLPGRFRGHMAIVAQLVRAPVCGTGGRGFETPRSPHLLPKPGQPPGRRYDLTSAALDGLDQDGADGLAGHHC